MPTYREAVEALECEINALYDEIMETAPWPARAFLRAYMRYLHARRKVRWWVHWPERKWRSFKGRVLGRAQAAKCRVLGHVPAEGIFGGIYCRRCGKWMKEPLVHPNCRCTLVAIE